MANEELEQRGLLVNGRLKGKFFGDFEEINIGNTTLEELVRRGLAAVLPNSINFPFQEFKPPIKVSLARPDVVYARRVGDSLLPVAVREAKSSKKRQGSKSVIGAAEQSLFYAKALHSKVSVIYKGNEPVYIDVDASFKEGRVVFIDNESPWNPGTLLHLVNGSPSASQDPKPLAEKIWQIIWHATKQEPKVCLLTFVEIFVLKFLSDNYGTMPKAKSFYELTRDPQEFNESHQTTPIEYYVKTIRPYIKTLFPDNVLADENGLPELFGLKTIVSKTSIINGFAFLKSSKESIHDFNRTFIEILLEFEKFGKLVNIDSEFKLRLYETFLKRSARQQKLGQFFTPRNVVRPMIQMARLSSLNDGAVVLDPAAGVGGFVLEPMLFSDSLSDNLKFVNGLPERAIKTIGVDVDDDLHLLAKANMLLHLVEQVRAPQVSLDGLNKAMAQTFVLMRENKTLGSLQYPPQSTVDVILTNPPYVTDGSSEYRKALADVGTARPRNATPKKAGEESDSLDLVEYYQGCGLGVESLFMRYISKALKPGGRAFVVLPLGFLNRTEEGPKKKILDECNILASIQLPPNTFFNTAQKTYILALERRRTKADSRPQILCGLARTIGETLDWRRTPEPEKNDLARIAEQFVAWVEADPKQRDAVASIATGTGLIKFADPDNFSAKCRWDVTRFWSDDELVALGERNKAIDKASFLDEAETRLDEVRAELLAARENLKEIQSQNTSLVALDDENFFKVYSGDRIKTSSVKENPGDIPVYSCFKDKDIVKGRIDEAWLKKHQIAIEEAGFVTVNANGASVGKVFVRGERCAITDDVIIVRPTDKVAKSIDLRYLSFRLREVVAEGGFLYEAKLFQARVKELSVKLPLLGDGSFDLEAQRKIADAESRVDELVRKLSELGAWSSESRLY